MFRLGLMGENELFYSPDEGSGGTGTGDSQGNTSDIEGAITRSFERLLDRHSTPQDAAQTLYRENYSQREELRGLREDNTRLKEQVKKIPKEGSVVLTGEEATAYNQIVASGLALKDVPTIHKEHGERGAKLERFDREETLRSIAGKVGYNPKILMDRDQAAGGLVYEVKTETVDGKPVERVFVKVQGSNDSTELTAYATANWADYLPSLVVAATPGSGGTGSPAPTPHRAPVAFPRQPVSSPEGGNGGNLVDQFITNRDQQASSRTNPLRQANQEAR